MEISTCFGSKYLDFDVPRLTGDVIYDANFMIRMQSYEIDMLKEKLRLLEKDFRKVYAYGEEVFSWYRELDDAAADATSEVARLKAEAKAKAVNRAHKSTTTDTFVLVDVGVCTFQPKMSDAATLCHCDMIDVGISTDEQDEFQTPPSIFDEFSDPCESDADTPDVPKTLKNKKYTAELLHSHSYIVTDGGAKHKHKDVTTDTTTGPLFYGKDATIANVQLKKDRKKSKNNTQVLVQNDTPKKKSKEKKPQLTDEQFYAWIEEQNNHQRLQIGIMKKIKATMTLLAPRVAMTVELTASFLRQLGVPCFPVGMDTVIGNFMYFYSDLLLGYHNEMVNLAVWFRHMFKLWVRKTPDEAKHYINYTLKAEIAKCHKTSRMKKFIIQYPIHYFTPNDKYDLGDKLYLHDIFYKSDYKTYQSAIRCAFDNLLDRLIESIEKTKAWEDKRDAWVYNQITKFGICDETPVFLGLGTEGEYTAEDLERINNHYISSTGVEKRPEPMVELNLYKKEQDELSESFRDYWLQLKGRWVIRETKIEHDTVDVSVENYIAHTIIECADLSLTMRLYYILRNLSEDDLNIALHKTNHDICMNFHVHSEQRFVVSECHLPEVHRSSAKCYEIESKILDVFYFGKYLHFKVVDDKSNIDIKQVRFRNFVDIDGNKIPSSDKLRTEFLSPRDDLFRVWISVLDQLHEEYGDFSLYIFGKKEKGRSVGWEVCTDIQKDMKPVKTTGDIMVVTSGARGCPMFFWFERLIVKKFMNPDFWSADKRAIDDECCHHDPKDFLYSCLCCSQSIFNDSMDSIDWKNSYCNGTNMFRRFYNQFKGLEDYQSIVDPSSIEYKELMEDLHPYHADPTGEIGSTISTLRSGVLLVDIVPEYKTAKTVTDQEMTMATRLSHADNLEVTF